jgi:hypothetical protein
MAHKSEFYRGIDIYRPPEERKISVPSTEEGYGPYCHSYGRLAVEQPKPNNRPRILTDIEQDYDDLISMILLAEMRRLEILLVLLRIMG